MLYHKVSEIPLDMIEKARKQQKERQNMTVGDRLFKEVMSDEEDEYIFDECMMEGGKKRGRPRSYTLCMIANPAGYEQGYSQWKQTVSARHNGNGKKIVVNSSGYNQAVIG